MCSYGELHYNHQIHLASLQSRQDCLYRQLMLQRCHPEPTIAYHQPTYLPPPVDKPKFVSNFSIDTILSGTKSQEKTNYFEESQKNFMHRAQIHPNMFPMYRPEILEEEASKVDANADGNFRCYICNKDYSRRHALKIHFRTHTGYKPLSCNICGKPFGDPSNLNKHKKVHMNVEDSRLAQSFEKGISKGYSAEKLRLFSKLMMSENKKYASLKKGIA